MSEREQKLEVMLHQALQFVANSVVTRESKILLKEINEFLSTSPTSEWNEAIEAAASAADKVSQWSDDIAATIADDIRALKRRAAVSDTPRTDAAVKQYDGSWFAEKGPAYDLLVLCRELERERDEWKAKAEMLQKGIDDIVELMANTEGVSGFYQSGKIASWEELLSGSICEWWLKNFKVAIAKEQP